MRFEAEMLGEHIQRVITCLGLRGGRFGSFDSVSNSDDLTPFRLWSSNWEGAGRLQMDTDSLVTKTPNAQSFLPLRQRNWGRAQG